MGNHSGFGQMTHPGYGVNSDPYGLTGGYGHPSTNTSLSALYGHPGTSPLFVHPMTALPSPQRVSTINVTIPFRSIVNIKHLKESMKEILEKSSHSNNHENG